MNIFSESLSTTIILNRQKILMIFGVLLFAIIFFRFYYLQIIETSTYLKISENNRIQLKIINPFRGTIADRNGNLLAENMAYPTIAINPSQVESISQLLKDIDAIIPLSDETIEQFNALYQSVPSQSTLPIPLLVNPSERKLAALFEQKYRFPGLVLDSQMQRYYPYADLLAHVVGYVGQINHAEKQQIDATKYRGTYQIGKTGIEYQYEHLLLGEVGYEYVEIDVAGVVQKIIERQDAVGGSNLNLFIDVHLQLYIQQLLNNYRGAVTVIDIATGGILAMVSKPSFNANSIVQGISHTEFDQIINNPDKPMMNRNIMGQYPPGSIIKPFLGLVALQNNTVDSNTKIYDQGYYQMQGSDRLYRDWKREGHGEVDLYKSIVESCDVFFYQIGFNMGIERLQMFAKDSGFGDKTGIDLPYEKNGYFPNEQSKNNFGGHLLNLSIGQGDMLVTPLQAAQNTAIIARRGVVIPPQLLKAVNGQNIATTLTTRVEYNEEYWDLIIASMVDVIDSDHGTARIIRNSKRPWKIAGKTGTAQKIGIAQDAEYESELIAEYHRDHAWFTAFAPVSNPQIAVAVFIENGEKPSRNAVPIANNIIQYWMQKQTATNLTQVK